MKKKSFFIPGYGGGIANSPYAPLVEQSFQTTKNLDVYTQQRVLRPYINLANQATSPAMSSAKVEMFSPTATGSAVYYFGNSASSNKLRPWYASLIGAPGTKTLNTISGGDGSNTTAPDQFADYAVENAARHHIAELNGYMLHWTDTKLSRVTLNSTPASSSYSEDPYTWSHGGTPGPIFTHKGLRKVFIAVDNKVYSLDSTTVSGSTDPTLVYTADASFIIKSFTSYGRFIAFGLISKADQEQSRVVIHDGSATTAEDELYLGDTGLQSIRNINGTIFVLATNVSIGVPDGYLRIYATNGSGFLLMDELLIRPGAAISSGNTNYKCTHIIDDAAVDVYGDRLYWAMRGQAASSETGLLDITNGIYCYGKFESNQPRVLTLALTTTNSATDYSFTCLKVISGMIHVAFNNGTNWYYESQIANATVGAKSSSGVYESNIFPLDNDGGLKRGIIDNIEIHHEAIPTSTGFTVSIKHYGINEISGTVSSDSYTDLTTPQGSGSSTGKTQSTNNATYTIIKGTNTFKRATHAQIKISYDEVSGTQATGIIFPGVKITTLIEE